MLQDTRLQDREFGEPNSLLTVSGMMNSRKKLENIVFLDNNCGTDEYSCFTRRVEHIEGRNYVEKPPGSSIPLGVRTWCLFGVIHVFVMQMLPFRLKKKKVPSPVVNMQFFRNTKAMKLICENILFLYFRL